MSNRSSRDVAVVLLAYAHRYVWPFLLIGGPLLFGNDMRTAIPAMSAGSVLYALYTFIGYKCRWKHIYCSYQNANYQEMTPNNIRWDKVKKSDAYGVPCAFAGIGLFVIVIGLFSGGI